MRFFVKKSEKICESECLHKRELYDVVCKGCFFACLRGRCAGDGFCVIDNAYGDSAKRVWGIM